MIPTRESMLLPPVQRYFSHAYCKRATEVPFYDHRIDLYGYSPSTDCSIAVELKLRKWRRAFQQALVYQLCSDYVFIAVPEATAHRIDVDRLREYGIGLLSISDDRCSEDLPAASSPVLNARYKAAYRAILLR